MNPRRWAVFHAVMTVVWFLLLIPSLLWWKESILWVIVLSVWANAAGHWSSYQAAKADEHNT
jgi:hypothetical protein